MIKICFVCHGNICRSTMAESIMTYLVKRVHQEKNIVIASAGTSNEECGSPVHHGTREELKKRHIPCVEHRARQLTESDYGEYDYLICMDKQNIRNVHRIVGADVCKKVHLLLSFAGRENIEVADPWYTGDFEEAFEDIWEGCTGLLTEILH